MAKEKIEFRCWKCSNLVTLFIPKKEHNKFIQKVEEGKKVCPNCKPNNELMTCVDSPMLISKPKIYKCNYGHLTAIYMFGDGKYSIVWGPDSAEKENVSNLDFKLQCNHTSLTSDDCPVTCDNTLIEIDPEHKLSAPIAPGIKTKTRVGDIWDKANVPEAKLGRYDDNGTYRETSFEKRNKERLSRMKRDRVIPLDHLPGREILEKPTDRKYNRNAKRPGKSDL